MGSFAHQDHLDVLEGAELVAGDEKSDKARHGGDRARVEVGQGGVRAETLSTMMITRDVSLSQNQYVQRK